MLFRSLPFKSRKGLTRDVSETFAIQTGLVHDVTGADCRAQNGNTHGRVSVTL